MNLFITLFVFGAVIFFTHGGWDVAQRALVASNQMASESFADRPHAHDAPIADDDEDFRSPCCCPCHYQGPGPRRTNYERPNGVAVADKDRGGYVIDGSINDNPPIRFRIDTGADRTIIPQRVAQTLGLHGEYSGTIGTANGGTPIARVPVDSLQIGGILVHDVPIYVIPDLPPEEQGLLGTDFLDAITQQGGHWGVENDKFVIRANSTDERAALRRQTELSWKSNCRAHGGTPSDNGECLGYPHWGRGDY